MLLYNLEIQAQRFSSSMEKGLHVQKLGENLHCVVLGCSDGVGRAP